MKHLVRATILLIAASLLTACGGEDSHFSSKTVPNPAPKPVDVRVVLHDSPPLDALYNLDGIACTSQSFMDAMNGDNTKITVTLKNADDTTVGLQDLEKTGGVFDKKTGCEWVVKFEQVDPSKFYSAEVASNGQGGLDETGQAQTDGAEAEITIDF